MFHVQVDASIWDREDVDWGDLGQWHTRTANEALASGIAYAIRLAMQLRRTAPMADRSLVLFIALSETDRQDDGLLDIKPEGSEKEMQATLDRCYPEGSCPNDSPQS